MVGLVSLYNLEGGWSSPKVLTFHCPTLAAAITEGQYWNDGVPVPFFDDEDEEAGAAVVSVAFAESGWCSTGAADGTIKVWDISGSARLRCSLGCGGAVVAMAWRPSSLVVVACSADGCIHAWDARDGSSLLQLRGHSDAPLCLATAWAQDAIVTAGDDRTVRVFRVPSADLPRPPPGSAPAPAPAPMPPRP